MIKHLLTFARQSEGEDSPLYIVPLIKENLRVIRSLVPSNVRLVENITGCGEIVNTMPCDVQQIIINLINNANSAMQPHGGTLTVTLDAVELQENLPTMTGMLQPGKYVYLQVSDTGCGMEEEVLEHIFEPFFTTKKNGEGNGLGLSMLHGSVLRCGGRIHVESTPGKGTVFNIYWPQCPEKTIPVPTTLERVSGEGVSVVIIDDRPDFNEVLAINLHNHDYEVTTFVEPADALDFLKEHDRRVNIVIVDYMMPEMNGEEFAQAVHEIQPELPIILLTGFEGDVSEENASEHGFCTVFEKPVEIERLSHALRQHARR